MEFIKAPISEKTPFGIYLKGDKAKYRAMRNHFNAAQAAWRCYSETPVSLADKDLASANSEAWATLRRACIDCLTNVSKDLEILCWYIASLVHGEKPFQTLAEALTSVADLVDEGLVDLQPILPEEKRKAGGAAGMGEVAELKLRPFTQLVGEVEGGGLLHHPVSNLPLLDELSYGQLVIADKQGRFAECQSIAAEAIAAETENMLACIGALTVIKGQFGRLDNALRSFATKHEQAAPQIGFGERLADEILVILERLLRGSSFSWPGSNEEEITEAQAEDVQNDATESPSERTDARESWSTADNLANRQDALRSIAKLAKFFRSTEPHSPICLLLDRAVRWGNLSAGELYREILSDGSEGMRQMSLMTGLESQGYADNFGAAGGSKAIARAGVKTVAQRPVGSYAGPAVVANDEEPSIVSASPEISTSDDEQEVVSFEL